MVEYRPTSPWTVDRGRVAQLVEQRTENPRVEGSSPPPTTIRMQKRSLSGALFLRARLLSSGHARMLHVKHPCGTRKWSCAGRTPVRIVYKKRLYCTPIFHPEQGSTTNEEITYDCLALCTRVLLSAVLACALLIPVTAEEAHASDQPRIVKVGYTDSEGLLTKKR